MSGKYAKETRVSVERSKIEIEKVLLKYGAQGVQTGYFNSICKIEFLMNDRLVRIMFKLPEKDDRRFTRTERGRSRAEKPAFEEWQKEVRRMWRAVLLVIKAKLEAVESGITTFEQEFLSFIVLPGSNITIGETILPKLDSGELGNLLLPAPEEWEDNR